MFKNHTHAHTHSLPFVCKDVQDPTFPNWKWKAWLTLSLSFPAAPPSCLEHRGVQGVGTLTYNAEASSLYVTPATKPGTYSQAGLQKWKTLMRRTLWLLSISSPTFGVTCGIKLSAVWALKIAFTILWTLEYIFQNYSFFCYWVWRPLLIRYVYFELLLLIHFIHMYPGLFRICMHVYTYIHTDICMYTYI